MASTFQDRLVAELRLADASSMEEANQVLWEYLPRFNQRFGVQAAGPGPTYREVQERLDGSLVVCCQGKVLTPAEASPLAAELRKRPQGYPRLPLDPWPPDAVREGRRSESKPKATPGWEGEWYQDEARRRTHRELVLAGMERARLRGSRIGRPRVTEREGFRQRFEAVVERIGPGGISRRQAARELAIGYATLKRLLDAHPKPAEQGAGESSVSAATVSYGDANAYAEVLY